MTMTLLPDGTPPLSGVAKTLDAALDLLDDGRNWIQGNFARDAEGHHCPTTSPKAICFCAVGAIEHIACGDANRAWRAFRALASQLPAESAFGPRITDWNDDDATTWVHVRDVFTKAIAASR